MNAPTRELPHGGTPDGLRAYFLTSGKLGDEAFGRLSDAAAEAHPDKRPPIVTPPAKGDRSADPLYIAHLAAYGCYATVVLLDHIRETFGDEAWHAAAEAVEELGVNGADFAEDEPVTA